MANCKICNVKMPVLTWKHCNNPECVREVRRRYDKKRGTTRKKRLGL